MVAARDPAWRSARARARSSSSTTRRTTATRTSCSSIPTTTPTRKTRSATATPGSGSGACCDLRRKAGIKAVYDLSATPYYLKGSGYNEGFIFPWVVSDFSLMDAIESGIVKVPRIPVDDDAAGEGARLPATCGTTSSRRCPSASSQGRSTSDGSAGCRRRRSKARCAACTAATQTTTLATRPGARRARRAAAGDDRRLPEHGRVEARVRLDRRAARSSCPTAATRLAAGQPLAAQQRRGRRLDARGSARSSSTPRSSSRASRWAPSSRRTRRARSKRSSRPTACATPAPTSTSSPMPTCCARR